MVLIINIALTINIALSRDIVLISYINYDILSLGVPPNTNFKAILTSHIVFISFLVNSIYSNN